MSLGSITNTALKALTANQLAMTVASNNIANAQTPEYARQRLVITPSGPGAESFRIGTGVDVVGVQALRDHLVDSRLRQETSAKSGEQALAHALGDVEVLFNDGDDTGLLKSLTDFFNAFHSLSLDTTSMNFREELKMKANTLAGMFSGRNADLKNIQDSADDALAAEVKHVNNLISQIAAVTENIKMQETQHVSHDLRTHRAALVRELSKSVELNELESESGDYQLTTKSNRLLVFNVESFKVNYNEVTSNFGNGSLASKVQVRDTYIPKYLAALDQLAYEVVQQVNTVHAASYTLLGTTGINFFAPLAAPADASRQIALSSDVAGDARKIAASELATGNDNRAALKLGNLLHSPVFSGGAVTDQYRNLVFTVGSDLSTARSNLREHEALEHQLENRRATISGVSIEEETVQILQFQRSYEASARVIRVVDEMLQMLIEMSGR